MSTYSRHEQFLILLTLRASRCVFGDLDPLEFLGCFQKEIVRTFEIENQSAFCFHIFMSTIFIIVRQLTIFLLRKLAKFLLPIPLFPRLSNILAKFVGLKTTTSTPVRPNPSNPNPQQPDPVAMHKIDLTHRSVAEERLKTWRQRNLLELSIHAREAETAEDVVPGEESSPSRTTIKTPRIRIDHIEFESHVENRGVRGNDAKETVLGVPPTTNLDLPSRVLPVQPSIGIPPIHDVSQTTSSEIQDKKDPSSTTYIAFARLSAEKQVYEQSKEHEHHDPPPTPPTISRPPTPPPPKSPTSPPKSPSMDEASPKSTSTDSSLYLGPMSGEVIPSYGLI